MHTYLVTFANNDNDTYQAEGINFTNTHVVLFANSHEDLVAAFRADTVLMIEEIDQREDAPC